MPEQRGWQREELKAVRREYAGQLADRVRGIEEAVAALREVWDADRVELLYHQIHRLGGSAGVHGFAEVSRAAQALEEVLLSVRERTGEGPQHPLEELARLLKALQGAAAGSRA